MADSNPTTTWARLPEFVVVNGLKFARSTAHTYEFGGPFLPWPLAITVNDCVYWQERQP